MSLPYLMKIEELRPLITYFKDLPWPQPPEAMQTISEDLGWTNFHSIEQKVALANTGYLPEHYSPANFSADTHCMFATPPGIMKILFTICTGVVPHDHNQMKWLKSSFATLVANISTVLGIPSTLVQGKKREQAWDLPTQGRIQLCRYKQEVYFLVLSPQWADTQRQQSNTLKT